MPKTRPRRLFAGTSLQTGAFQFIPLPFVDDWLTARQRWAMVRSILNERGISYDGDVPRLLAGGGRSLVARAGSLAKGAVMKPMRKILRTTLFWMTVRRAALVVVETYLLARFLHLPALGGQHLTADDGRRLARIFEEISQNLDLKAARDVVEKVNRILAKEKPVPSEEMQTEIERDAPGLLARFDQLAAERLRAG